MVEGRCVADALVRKLAISLFNDEQLCLCHLLYERGDPCWIDGILRQGQLLHDPLYQFTKGQEAMSIFGSSCEYVGNSCLIPKIRIGRDSQIAGNRISSDEADPVNIRSKLVRILGNDLYCLITVLFLDFHCVRGRYLVALQEHHHFLDGFLCFPGGLDPLDTTVSNAWNFDEAGARLLNDLQRV